MYNAYYSQDLIFCWDTILQIFTKNSFRELSCLFRKSLHKKHRQRRYFRVSILSRLYTKIYSSGIKSVWQYWNTKSNLHLCFIYVQTFIKIPPTLDIIVMGTITGAPLLPFCVLVTEAWNLGHGHKPPLWLVGFGAYGVLLLYCPAVGPYSETVLFH